MSDETSISRKDYFVFGLRVFLGLFLLFSSFYNFFEVRRIDLFESQLTVLPAVWIERIARYFAVSEALAGVCLLAGRFIRQASAVIFCLFLILISSNIPSDIRANTDQTGHSLLPLVSELISLSIALVLFLYPSHRFKI